MLSVVSTGASVCLEVQDPAHPLLPAQLDAAWAEIAADPGIVACALLMTGPPSGPARAGLRLPGPLDHEVWAPAIAAVDGVVESATLALLAQFDVIVATRSTVFAPATELFAGSAVRAAWLRARFGLAARELCLPVGKASGRRGLSAVRAHELGLVSDLSESLRATVSDLLERFAENSPTAMAVTKRLMWSSAGQALAVSLADGGRALAAFAGHPDAVEGPRAFAARARPRWGPRSLPTGRVASHQLADRQVNAGYPEDG